MASSDSSRADDRAPAFCRRQLFRRTSLVVGVTAILILATLTIVAAPKLYHRFRDIKIANRAYVLYDSAPAAEHRGDPEAAYGQYKELYDIVTEHQSLFVGLDHIAARAHEGVERLAPVVANVQYDKCSAAFAAIKAEMAPGLVPSHLERWYVQLTGIQEQMLALPDQDVQEQERAARLVVELLWYKAAISSLLEAPGVSQSAAERRAAFDADPSASFRDLCERLIRWLRVQYMLGIGTDSVPFADYRGSGPSRRVEIVPVSGEFAYNVQKTDSLTTPLVATLEYAVDQHDRNITIVFGYSNGKWAVRSVKHVSWKPLLEQSIFEAVLEHIGNP